MTIFVPYFPLLLALIGVLVYALAVNPKAAEIGRVMFWCGLLAWLLRSFPGK